MHYSLPVQEHYNVIMVIIHTIMINSINNMHTLRLLIKCFHESWIGQEVSDGK